jgi:hypothetical protein
MALVPSYRGSQLLVPKVDTESITYSYTIGENRNMGFDEAVSASISTTITDRARSCRLKWIAPSIAKFRKLIVDE